MTRDDIIADTQRYLSEVDRFIALTRDAEGPAQYHLLMVTRTMHNLTREMTELGKLLVDLANAGYDYDQR